jgi:hypothetical protein
MTNHIQFSLLTLTIFFSTLFANTLYAQQNALKITPFQPLLGKFSLSYEYTVRPKTTVMVEYQRWLGQHQSNIRSFSLGLLATAKESGTNKGYRMTFMARQYTQAAMNGTFFEGGFYVGKHDIVTRTETSVLLPDPDLFFLPVYETTVEEKKYNDVRVAGLKAGAGWQKSAGIFTFECAGGLSLNVFNDKNVRPTLSMKPVSLYGRLAVGVRF